MKHVFRFDNLKVLLMLLVITAHTLSNSYGFWGMEVIRFYCLCFTMPLFTFISGYLSKPEMNLKKNIQHLLWPCIIFTVVNDSLRAVVDSNYIISWKQPGFAMWYLWVLFVFRISLPMLLKIPHIETISFIFSWLIGFIPWAGTDFSLQRLVCFLPWFIIGYKFSTFESLSKKLINANGGGKWIFLLAACFAFWTVVIIIHPGLTYATSFATPYGENPILHLFLRMALQLTIAITGWCVIRLTPNRILWYSKYGRNTMSAYLLHALIVLPFAYCVFPPFADATLFVKVCMIMVPLVCCIPLFSGKIHKSLMILLKI